MCTKSWRWSPCSDMVNMVNGMVNDTLQRKLVIHLSLIYRCQSLSFLATMETNFIRPWATQHLIQYTATMGLSATSYIPGDRLWYPVFPLLESPTTGVYLLIRQWRISLDPLQKCVAQLEKSKADRKSSTGAVKSHPKHPHANRGNPSVYMPPLSAAERTPGLYASSNVVDKSFYGSKDIVQYPGAAPTITSYNL